MRMVINNVRLIPYEDCYMSYIYRWQHSGDYNDFFGNVPMLTLGSTDPRKEDNEIFMIVNKDNPQEVYGLTFLAEKKDRDRNLLFGIMVDKAVQNNKICLDVTKLIMYYAFNAINYYKIISLVNAGNEKTNRIIDEFGFEKEGVLKHECYDYGSFHDVTRFRLLKGSYNKKYKKEVDELVK